MTDYRVIKTKARLFEMPEDSNMALYKAHGSELLYGEVFSVNETKDGWAKGVSAVDDYEGWINLSALHEITGDQKGAYEASQISIPMAPIYIEPHLKAHIKYHVPFMGRVLVNPLSKENGYYQLNDAAGWIHESHIRPFERLNKTVQTEITVEALIKNICATAQLFHKAPYIYGGRTVFGLDCSALIQLSYAAQRIKIARDSKPQAKMLHDFKVNDQICTKEIALVTPLETGDIVFFPGHVGLMLDHEHIIHASSRLMRVEIEPFVEVDQYYLNKEGQGLTAIRRMCST